MQIDRRPVESTNLLSVGYDENTNFREIEFCGERLYRYSDVPTVVYESPMRAPSKGSYFHDQIRDRYAYERIR